MVSGILPVPSVFPLPTLEHTLLLAGSGQYEWGMIYLVMNPIKMLPGF